MSRVRQTVSGPSPNRVQEKKEVSPMNDVELWTSFDEEIGFSLVDAYVAVNGSATRDRRPLDVKRMLRGDQSPSYMFYDTRNFQEAVAKPCTYLMNDVSARMLDAGVSAQAETAELRFKKSTDDCSDSGYEEEATELTVYLASTGKAIMVEVTHDRWSSKISEYASDLNAQLRNPSTQLMLRIALAQAGYLIASAGVKYGWITSETGTIFFKVRELVTSKYQEPSRVLLYSPLVKANPENATTELGIDASAYSQKECFFALMFQEIRGAIGYGSSLMNDVARFGTETKSRDQPRINTSNTRQARKAIVKPEETKQNSIKPEQAPQKFTSKGHQRNASSSKQQKPRVHRYDEPLPMNPFELEYPPSEVEDNHQEEPEFIEYLEPQYREIVKKEEPKFVEYREPQYREVPKKEEPQKRFNRYEPIQADLETAPLKPYISPKHSPRHSPNSSVEYKKQETPRTGSLRTRPTRETYEDRQQSQNNVTYNERQQPKSNVHNALQSYETHSAQQQPSYNYYEAAQSQSYHTERQQPRKNFYESTRTEDYFPERQQPRINFSDRKQTREYFGPKGQSGLKWGPSPFSKPRQEKVERNPTPPPRSPTPEMEEDVGEDEEIIDDIMSKLQPSTPSSDFKLSHAMPYYDTKPLPNPHSRTQSQPMNQQFANKTYDNPPARQESEERRLAVQETKPCCSARMTRQTLPAYPKGTTAPMTVQTSYTKTQKPVSPPPVSPSLREINQKLDSGIREMYGPYPEIRGVQEKTVTNRRGWDRQHSNDHSDEALDDYDLSLMHNVTALPQRSVTDLPYTRNTEQPQKSKMHFPYKSTTDLPKRSNTILPQRSVTELPQRSPTQKQSKFGKHLSPSMPPSSYRETSNFDFDEESIIEEETLSVRAAMKQKMKRLSNRKSLGAGAAKMFAFTGAF